MPFYFFLDSLLMTGEQAKLHQDTHLIDERPIPNNFAIRGPPIDQTWYVDLLTCRWSPHKWPLLYAT
jgi:hypothetical protein